ncbi:MAG: YihY/virulence factor BrkB family protein [Flavisolibacter sp.]
MDLGKIIKDTISELLKNDPLRMAGATAFFTTFALPPILVILIQVFQLFVGDKDIRVELFSSLSNIVGPEAVKQIVDVLQSMKRLAENWMITVLGFIFLVFVATTLFKIIKSSINQVWKIREHKRAGFIKSMSNRLKAVIVILIAGVLFVLGILAEGLKVFIGEYIFEISPLVSFYFHSVLNYIISILVVTIWFMMVFRYLPDGRPEWRIAFGGGFITAILFTIGKLILHWMLSYSNITTVYGASASIVLLLLFVFYSSLILYFGAAFTKIWGIYKNQPIEPLPHARHYRVIEE